MSPNTSAHLTTLNIATPKGRRRIRSILGIDPKKRFPTAMDQWQAAATAASKGLAKPKKT